MFAVASLLALTVASSLADDWPPWRGPNRDGVWRETGILETMPPHGLKARWRARIGAGYSGPVVADGRVFVTDRRLRPNVERVLCFEEQIGQVIVRTADAVSALEPATGELAWQVRWKMAEDYFVIASSVRHDDLLLLMSGWGRGSKMLRLDRTQPGASVLWEARRDVHASMTTPIFLDDRYFCAVDTYGELGCFDVTFGHQGAVYCLAFSSDGKTLASGNGDETVRLWDVASAMDRTTLRGHQSGLSAVAFTPDGKTLASAGLEDALRLWELLPGPSTQR